MMPSASLELSGERFQVVYRLVGDEAEVRARAQEICLEQTVEFPGDLVPAGDIRDQIVGHVERVQPVAGSRHEVTISYAVEAAGRELPQLLNVIFGNISLKPGIRVERLELPELWLQAFRGPRFGREGWRARLGAYDRPLLCAAIKPLGLPTCELGHLAYQFALGGMDMIKDDHGLADQPFARYRERVERCVEAVERAGRETGRPCLYLPSVNGPADEIWERASFARQAGAGGLLVSPGLVGFDVMRCLADDERLALPIMSHPALQGAFVTSRDNGVSHYALFGQIARLAGADASVYPNYGGRFSFTREECRSIVEGTGVAMGHLRPCFPTPAGGMGVERVAEMIEFYGREVILLIGGGLYRGTGSLIEHSCAFRESVERLSNAL